MSPARRGTRALSGVVLLLLLLGVLAMAPPIGKGSSQPPGEVTLASPNPQSGGLYGNFGSSVAMSGGTVVVGAAYENVSGVYSAGRAYVFNAATGALTENLTSPNPQNDGGFGSSVAMSGNTVVVGAPLKNSAYVFNAATGALTETLTSPNPHSGAIPGEFGLSVAVSGDTLVVGAPYEFVGVDHSYPYGRAYVFNAATGALTENLTSPNPQNDGGFGSSVAMSGNTVVVGADGEDSAYVFNAATGALTENLTSPDPSFGSSVAVSGDTLVVGAPFAPVGGNFSVGRAYVFNAATGALTENLTSPDPQGGGFFGDSVALSGGTLVVGAYGETVGGTARAGRAYVLSILTTTANSGVPEFPILPLAAIIFTVAVTATYVVARRTDRMAFPSLVLHS